MFGKKLIQARLLGRRGAALEQISGSDRGRARTTAGRKVRTLGAAAALLGMVATALVTQAGVQAAPAPVGQGFTVTPGDLAFILKQIKIAERHSRSFTNTNLASDGPNPPRDALNDPEYCSSLVGSNANQIPDYLTSYGLRTVDGGCNNLVPVTQPDGTKTNYTFAKADQPFPRLTTPVFRDAEPITPSFPVGPPGPTSYKQKSGSVIDSQPREISNLIVDQTSTNPAAVAAAGFPVRTQGNPGLVPCDTVPGSDPPVDITPLQPDNCVPAHHTLFIPNVTTDVGLSPPYNSLFTFFGQFFDHGVDQTVKSGGTVFVPLHADDPLVLAGPDGIPGNGDEVPPNQAFMVLTRAQNQPGPDGTMGTADDIQNANNTDTPWVDQSQTYTSHSSHQVFLREYVNNGAGQPVSTGKLLDGIVADDPLTPGCSTAATPCYNDGNATTGSISTWAATKKQAAELLGLKLVDTDVTNIPMIAADPYGKFIPGPARGLPQYVTTSGGLVEGCRASDAPACVGPVPVPADAQHFDTPFLTDIAHNADPSAQDTDNNPGTPPVFPTPDTDLTASADFASQPAGTYDDEMLNDHFTCGDGRCNENIALSTIHQIFHHEHDRLVDYIKDVLTTDALQTASGAAALPEWKPGGAAFGTDGWNGERLFQAARFVTEMEYQHLVFEEFARKIQPAVRPFHVYSSDINAAIPAEFAHAVYRFGHSMLDDDVARTNVDPLTGAHTDNSIPLLTAFLNPPEYFNGGTAGTLSPERAAASVVMGSSDQIGNELDEFVVETLRNNLLGLPLDLPTLNMTRARDAGIPPLNDVRRQIFAQTNDGQLQPYTSWSDFGQHLKHPESLINFVAAYGTHPSIISQTTLVGKRAAAKLIVDPADPTDPLIPTDAADFMFSTGPTWGPLASGVTTTGLDSVDLWVGGLAEITNLFGGLLGTTFNYVFETSLENLQDGDRLYYLARTPGMNLRTQLEGNSFSELIMRNTDGADTLKADAFATADCKFQLSALTGDGSPGVSVISGLPSIIGAGSVNDDPATTDCDENQLLLRQPDGTIQYRQVNTVDPVGINGQSVYNGTPAVDRIFGGNDNDTFWGGAGNDRIEGNGGDDVALGGDGNDIITDLSGADVEKGGPGNDALDGGIGDDIFMGGDGSDFINGGANDNESFAGPGNDFIIAGQGADAVFGDGGDDWIEGGSGQDLLQGDHGAPFFDDPAEIAPGNDILIGQVGENDYDAEGGDDVMAQNSAIDRNAGAGGFDWAFHQYNTVAADDDMEINNNLVGVPIQVVVNRDRWQETEADSGGRFNDVIRGTSVAPSTLGGAGFTGCDALDAAGVARISGLNALVTTFPSPLAPIVAASAAGRCPLTGPNVWAEGDILLGGAGNDTIDGRGANDIIDGDRALQVRISVRTDPADPATQIGTTDLMEHQATSGNFGPGTAGMTLQQAVFAGLTDPGNLVGVREIVTTGVLPTDVDTALFSQPQANYDIGVVNGVVTVNNARPTAALNDGIDTLRNIEVLSFCSVPSAVRNVCTTRAAPVLVSSFPSANVSPTSLVFGTRLVGSAAITQPVTVTNAGGGSLIVSSFSITGTNAASFPTPTSNCVTLTAGASCTITVSFRPTVAGSLTANLNINTNANAGQPIVVSLTGTGVANSPATGAPTISDITPTEGAAITASPVGIADANGLPATFTFQWRQSNVGGGGALTNIVGATSATFTPLQAQTNRRLAVVVSFVDLGGSPESRTSASTTVVGDLFPGVGDSNAGIDILAGTAGEDEYHGGPSADSLSTGAGDDIVSGDAGDDTITTGAGDDTITFSGTGEGFDAVTGGANVDEIDALSDGTDIGLRSVATVENISANGHTGVRIAGSAAADTLNFAALTLTGITAIDGGGGNDTLTGSGIADVIIGGAGLDTLNGVGGDDIIEGGADNDTMNGGAGNDVFRYFAGFGTDTIAGFDSNPVGGQDKIDLRSFGFTTTAAFNANVSIVNVGGTTVITVLGQGVIRLTGVAAATVTSTDFMLV